MLQCYEWIVRCHRTMGRGTMMIACSSTNWGALKFKRLCFDSMAGDWKQAHLTLSVNCTVRRSLCLTWAFNILCLRTSLLMGISSYNLFSDTGFGCPNIQLVRIELSLHSMHWELRPLWVSAVHRWAAIFQSGWTESVFCDFRLETPALLTETELAEAILGFQSIGPSIYLGLYWVQWHY